jgi:2-polyprenyl-3-methyl-5-hydroxy-6-metoxy-1,4-benzoquinol methylase
VKPARRAWERQMPPDNHIYQYSFDPEGDSAGARVLKMIPRNTRVLELGAGPGSITKYISGTLGCDVVAIEIDSAAAAILQQFVRIIHSLDLNSSDWDGVIEQTEGRFQTVLAADVLEHLYWPEVTLEKMKGLLSDDGSVVLSLPHVAHSAVIASLLDEDFEYRNAGLLDRTHIRFFGLKNIQALHERAGLAIEEAHFVVRAPETTEFRDRWGRMPSDVRDVLGRYEFGKVYQVVTRAVPRERATRSIELMSMRADLSSLVR